ncbi:MAG: hypothetical protein KatS3mg002_1332 [Candidatus Woesearchaeota archaeon]|nr:MAG: hypothetical protein KatS3mg002_1332 [Candidatus Woesearchaeota archaeon]
MSELNFDCEKGYMITNKDNTINLNKYNETVRLHSLYSSDDIRSDIVTLILLPYFCKADTTYYDYCLSSENYDKGLLLCKATHIIKNGNVYYSGTIKNDETNSLVVLDFMYKNKNTNNDKIFDSLSNGSIFLDSIYNISSSSILTIIVSKIESDLYNIKLLLLEKNQEFNQVLRAINNCKYDKLPNRYVLSILSFYNILYTYNSITKETNKPSLSKELSNTIKTMVEIVSNVEKDNEIDFLKRLYIIVSLLSKHKYPIQKNDNSINIYDYFYSNINITNTSDLVTNEINKHALRNLNIHKDDIDIAEILFKKGNVSLFERIREFNAIDVDEEFLRSINFYEYPFEVFTLEGELVNQKYLIK